MNRIWVGEQAFIPNRVFCIGKNYFAHVEEMGENRASSEPVVFMKPASSLVPPGQPLNCPIQSTKLHHEVEAVLLIGDEGKNILKADSLSFIAGITIGLDLTLRDVQNRLKKAGHPWELSKAFEQSAPIGNFQPYNPDNIDIENWSFECRVNGELRQNGNTRNMIFSIKTLIRKLSQWWVLKPGDIIFTGTPNGVGLLVPGDKIEIQSPRIGSFAWIINDLE